MNAAARGAGPSAARRPALSRSVLLSQLLFAGAVLILVCVVVVFDPTRLTSMLSFIGLSAVFATTLMAAGLPWNSLPHWCTAAVPILDAIAIFVIRFAIPDLGVGLMLVFPVIWLASYYGRAGAFIGPIIATGGLWLSRVAVSSGPITAEEIGSIVVLPITLTFIAGATYATTRKSAAQRILLRRQAEALETALDRVRLEEKSLAAVLNSVQFGVIGLDADRTIKIVNDTMRSMASAVRIEPSAMLHRPPAYREDRVTPFGDEDLPFRRAVDGESFENLVVWLGHPGERRIAMAVSSRQLHRPDGVLETTVITSRDITSEINAIQARDDLVTSVSHELRTPLTSILGYLDLSLDAEELSEETRGMLEVASKNVDRLLELVSEILSAGARDSELTVRLTGERSDLVGIARESIDTLRPAAIEQVIALILEQTKPISFYGDAFRLRQVMDNLLSNAIKYNKPGGKVTVAIDKVDGDSVEIRVADTGIGMTEQEQSGLFQKFYRAESVRGGKIHGTGLGLAISSDIITRHGGSMRIESVKGEGTTVIIRMPRHPVSGTPAVTGERTA